MHLCVGVGDSPAMIRLHARHEQRILEQMLEASKTDNVELKGQVYLCHTSTRISQRWFETARSSLAKGCSIVNAASLRFIPTSGRPPELTEDQEKLAARLLKELPILGH